MAQVIIPSPLRKHTDGLRDIRVDSATLHEVLQELVERYPALKSLMDRPALLSIFINGVMLREKPEAWSAVSIDEHDEITLIIPIAGG